MLRITEMKYSFMESLAGGTIEQKYMDSPIIVKVEEIDDVEFDYQSCTQKAKITKIFKSDDIVNEGMEVRIIRDSFRLWEDNTMSTGFVNYMEKGKKCCN